MKTITFIFSILLLFLAAEPSLGESTAKKRASKIGIGMNVSFLDQYWRGTRELQFSDFVKVGELQAKRQVFREIKKAGFSSVRIPINFGAWATIEKPYKWRDEKLLTMADRFIDWALEEDLIVIVDLHHVNFDGSVKGADDTERLTWIWDQIARRYKKHDPEKVLFELRNEPHDVSAEDWRKQAAVLIETVRNVSKNHTLVVGFHDWNSRAALISSEPFKDSNIVYTFHYYDPFLFTHQGATWAGAGLEKLRSIEFPSEKDKPIKEPEDSGDWVSRMISTYGTDSRKSKIFADLKEARNWADKHDVPIFAGEFGSYGAYATEESRCRHASVVYESFGRLSIPNAWWEWDGGFSMFRKGSRKPLKCMMEAVSKFRS